MPHNDRLSSIAKLRMVLLQMEADTGIDHLTQNERDVLYAFHVVTNNREADITTEQVRGQPAVKNMAHATFHRALARLLELEYISRAPNSRAKLYRICGIPNRVSQSEV